MSKDRSKYIEMDGLKYRLSSLVYSHETSIFNLGGCATNCPSDAAGLCECGDVCYARRPELRWPNVKRSREKQRIGWNTTTAEQFIAALRFLGKKHNVKRFRFNEASDFHNQNDVDKLSLIAANVPQIVFGYTANDLLDYRNVPFFVKVSHFNSLCEGAHGRAIIIQKEKDKPKGFITCPKTSKKSKVKKCDEGCGLCWNDRPFDIAFVQH
jgi:hypothetical protein